MNRVGVVVLNYNNYNETIHCVRSIVSQEGIELKIVVVENGSANESYEKLVEEFSTQKSVHIIRKDINVGYAKGNNIGIKFLRDAGYDFIVVCNSDVIFSTRRILKTMVDSNDYSIGTMIPIIRNLDGSIEMRAQYRKSLFGLRILKELIKMQRIFKANNNINNIGNSMEVLQGGIQKSYFVITGSIFALTPTFFEHYNALFSETFLYAEELATLLLVYKAGLNTAIIDTDDVIHKGAASTGENLRAGTLKKRKMIAQSARKVMKLVFLPESVIRNL